MININNPRNVATALCLLATTLTYAQSAATSNPSPNTEKALGYVEKSEYHIHYQPKAGALQSPNRANNMRFTYKPNGFSAKPRVDSTAQWNIAFTFKGIYRNNILQLPAAKTATANTNNNHLLYAHNGYEIEYLNGTDGMRQNFIIKNKPAGQGPLAIKMDVDAQNLTLQCNDGQLTGTQGGVIQYYYKDLKVWDAHNKTIPATMQFTGNQLALIVNDLHAAYPLTIDPLSTIAATTLEANQASANYGYSVASAGDVNGDGYSDVIVGANIYDNGQTDEGAAFVYLGSATGISTTAAAMVESNQINAGMGRSVASAGDVNGDGYSDVIVGAYQYDNGQTDEGAAFVYHGSASGISTTPAAIVESNQLSAYMGYSVASAADVNGDGYSDVVVGAFTYDNGQTDEGRVFVYYGSASGISTIAGTTVESNLTGAYLGYSVASAGDVNGDGYSDVIAGAYQYTNGQSVEGGAFIYLGNAGGMSTTPATTLQSNQAGAYLGWSVASAGDVNGDGYSDVIVGASQYDNGQTDEGAAYIFHGSAGGISTTPAAIIESNQGSAYMGYSVASLGDINSDGYSDISIGARLYDNGQTDEGAAFVYQGSPTGINTTAVATLECNQATARMGHTAASAGDVNGDGYSDVIVGAFLYDNGQTDEGAAFVYHGSPNGINTTAAATVESNQASANMGWSVAGAGDVNADGYSDVIVGAPNYDNGQTDEGAAFIYHGSASGISITASATLESNQANAFLGYSVASAGDVNGDGYSDVIVGAYQYDNGQTDEGAAFVYHGSASGINTTAAAMVESNQASAYLGNAVAPAGDVNGDGYSDVIAGARNYDNGQTDEGAAFVYLGSASGISTTASATLETNQAAANMGWSVATAGDVNGDGYSDVIAGAPYYDNGQNDEGSAFVFHGSASGITTTPAATVECNFAGATMGWSVSTAGDVNGDGYSDVIVGAPLFHNGNVNEGGAFIYHGSPSGISTTPAMSLDPNFTAAQTGYSVSSAGDINGDGYSDVIVGAPIVGYTQVQNGVAFVFHGSATGITFYPAAAIYITQTYASLGWSVASAGDVNGDGNSDVVIGTPNYDNGESNEGRASVHYGNGGAGTRKTPRLFNSNTTTPIQQSNTAVSNFTAGLFAKNFMGRTKGKLVWEVKQEGQAFSSPLINSILFTSQQSSYTDLGAAGTQLTALIARPGNQTKIRVRLKYDPVTAITGQVYSPWIYLPQYKAGMHGMSSTPVGCLDVTVSAASSSPTLCINTALTNITHTTIAATGIGSASGLPPGVTASFASNTVTISGTPTGAGAFNYSIPVTGGCSTMNATGTITVNAVPAQPTIVTGAPVSICPPQTGLTLVTNNDPNATSYSWANSPGSNGITFNPVSTTNTQVIDVGTTVNSTYNIRVTATNACGSSLYRGVSIRRTTSTPASIAGSTVACAGQTYTYSTPVVVGAETYTWTATAGSSINGGGNTLTTASPSVSVQMPAVFTTGTVSVTANVACFVSSARVLNIGSTTPALSLIAGSVIACPGSSQTYTVPPSAGAVSYQWTLPANTSGASATNNINVGFNTGFSSANICVRATSVCEVQTVPRCISVATGLPLTPTIINGIANGICGQTVNYTTPAVPGATGYVWTLPSGASGASTSNSILVTYAPTGITTAPLTVRSQNSCGLSLPRTITIKGAPNSPGTITANPVSWCNTDPSINFTSNLGNVSGSYNLVWSFVPPTAASIQNGQGSNNLLVDWNTGNATVILTASNNCGSGTKTYAAVIGCRQAGEAIEQEVGSIAVYPNPAIDKVNIAFTTETSGNSTVKLLDVTGKVVMSNNYAFTAGSNTLQLDVAHLAKGVYMLEVKANTINNKTRLVIQ